MCSSIASSARKLSWTYEGEEVEEGEVDGEGKVAVDVWPRGGRKVGILADGAATAVQLYEGELR
jgi:hypothetical protein